MHPDTDAATCVPRALLSGLTAREVEVVTRLVQGMPTDAIATDLGLSPRTVRNYVGEIYRKTGAYSRVGLLLWWARAHGCCIFGAGGCR